MAVDTTQDLTELNAVNSVLAAIGQSPVTTLDYENPETSFVYNLIQECSRDVQDEGWVFNREEYYPLTPDQNKFITLPANVLRMDVSENDVYRTIDVIKRDGKLYDKLHHTFEFRNPLYMDIVWLFPLTDLPSVFQRYITSRASVRAAIQMIDNAQLSQLLQVQENTCRAACMEYEANQGDYNFMGFPPGTAYRTYRPYTALRRYP
jgi:hypothetical protein